MKTEDFHVKKVRESENTIDIDLVIAGVSIPQTISKNSELGLLLVNDQDGSIKSLEDVKKALDKEV